MKRAYQSNYRTDLNTHFTVLFLKDTSIELSTLDNSFLTSNPFLFVEVSLDGKVVVKETLSLCKSSSGIWEVDEILILGETFGHFTISVTMGADGDEYQLLGLVGSNGSGLLDTTGKLQTIPLACHEKDSGLVLKSRILAIEDSQELLSSIKVNVSRSYGKVAFQNMLDEVTAAHGHFKRYGDLDSLEQAILRLEIATEFIRKGDPKLPAIVTNLGACFLSRFEILGNLADLENAISQTQIAVDLTSDDHPSKPGRLNNLQNSLQTRFERLGNLEDLNNAISYGQMAINLTPDGRPDKSMSFSNHGTSLQLRFQLLGNDVDLDNAISAKQLAVDITSDGDPDKPTYLNNLGNILEMQFRRSGNVADLENAISRIQLAVSLTPDDHPDKIMYLANLGRSLETRFERFGNVVDLDNAISQRQRLVDLTPPNHPSKYTFLNDLIKSLDMRFKRHGNLTDVDHAISLRRMVVDLTPKDHPSKPGLLDQLGEDLDERFIRLGNIQDIEEAITQTQMAVDITPDSHPVKPRYLSNLGRLFEMRFNRLGSDTDLNNAISLAQMAVDLTPGDHPSRTLYLHNLGSCLVTQFLRFGHLVDLNNAIAHLQVVVSLRPDGHPDKARSLNDLGISLYTRFQHLGNHEDLDLSILYHQAIVDTTPDDDRNKPGYLTSLGCSLELQFQRLGDVVYLDNAILQKQMAVDLTPDGHPSKPLYLSNLGNSLETRFHRFGNVIDLDKAISQAQLAVDLTPYDHPSRPSYLSNLGSSLETRFRRLGNISDVSNAILHHQLAVKLIPDGNPDKPGHLNNLGNALEARFQRFEDVADIDDAITQKQMAVSLAPDGNPSKPMYLKNLGNSLETRYERLGNVADLEGAILQYQMAAELVPDSHPTKPMYLNNLGSSLGVRFQRLKDVVDIDNAILQLRMAVDLTPIGAPNKAMYTRNLGTAIHKRFQTLGHFEDAESTISCFSAAANSSVGLPVTRLKAARSWISIASLVGHDSLMAACECAVSLMPLVAWLGLPIPDRHQHLVNIGSIAREAAATAISVGQYDKAFEWLEQGRSIVWTQILHLRTPVDQLRDIDQGLADRLLEVSKLLYRGSGGKALDRVSVEEEGRLHRALTMEWDSIVNEIRSLPGFEDFLRPLRLSQLKGAARSGPLIVLNIAEKRCDALALLDEYSDISHIPLPKITSEMITQLLEELKGVLCSSGIRMRGERAARKVEDETDEETCRQILAKLWNAMVRPILDSLEFSPYPDILPRILWCATGPLAFLPIHAAGIYESPSSESQLSSYAISSYTPTLSALLEPPRPSMSSSFQLLSVIQSSAPGVSSIPNTKKELEYIQHHLGGREHVILDGAAGTKGRVMKAMEGCNWFHLACHGVQQPEEPTKSALILEDGRLTLEEIIKLNLPKAELAFLSACQTTTGDEKLSEEAVHIAGAMLLAGYRGVVATMWSIQDELAPEVADGFYGYILADGERPDSRKAAGALHYSLQNLRKRPGVRLIDWIPFVYLGV